MLRSTHRRCSIKKGVLKIFAKFTEKRLFQSLLFNKVAGLRQGCNFIKKEALEQVFSCEFCENFKNPFFIEHLQATVSEFSFFIPPKNCIKPDFLMFAGSI